jgi:hypothetical protein
LTFRWLPVLFLGLPLGWASPSSAQAPDRPSFGSAAIAVSADVVKAVFRDPTTYTPAIVVWTATRGDWNSSQVFFRNGFVEGNARFTLSGQSGDTPIAFAAGNHKILGDAFANLTVSMVNNAADEALNRLLAGRFPRHRTLIRAAGWVERSAMASFWSYREGAAHFEQWQQNDRMARVLGF